MSKLIVGNLKTYMDRNDVITYLKETSDLNGSIIICPTNIYIPYFLKHKYMVGLQDVSSEEGGNHTGDILARQAVSMGIKFSIIGHSERRNIETTEDINKKIIATNKYGITPILCVGEEKQSRKTKKFIQRYLSECLKNTLVNKVIIAYEPMWAIGTDVIPSNKEIEDIVIFIKDFIKREYDCDIRVLYGGSVTKENVGSLKLIDVIDGILVGNSSASIYEFKEIISKYLN